MPKLRTALSLSGAQFGALVEASALLVWARLLIAFVPLRHWRKQFGELAAHGASHPALSEAERETARLVVHAIDRAGRNLPFAFICLPRALAARWMLARRGVDSQLYIGVGRSDAGETSLHAWLKAGEDWITGYQESISYSAFVQRKGTVE